MTKIYRIILIRIIFFLFVVYTFNIQAQTDNVLRNEEKFRVMFYNVENLFDTYDDSLTRDEEFTPDGERHWTNRKFYEKINKIYKVIMATGAWEPPVLVGLSEIENRFVLEKLINETPLKNFGYRIIHYESPDRRGIDVALLYRESFFEPFHSEPVPVVFEDDSSYKTRDILYVKGLIDGQEMIHVFINHWPSRYGGYLATVSRRNNAASVLKQKTDSLLNINSRTAILMCGDFNDGPTDESFAQILKAQMPSDSIRNNAYYNLMLADQEGWNFGTLKYRESWDKFDQIVVSGSLLSNKPGLQVNKHKAEIFHDKFLLTDDKTYLGQKPFRTYTGFKYAGGYSDHLPVYLDLIILKKAD